MHKRFAVPCTGMAVFYALEVLNPDGSVARRVARKHNLILDSGLDLVASHYTANLTLYAAVGTNSTPVRRDSGAITFTRAGAVVTASANFFEAGDVGRLFKFDSGEEAYISGYTDPQNVTVSVSGAVAASEGTVWYVNQTGLFTESKRTNTYGGSSGDNGTTYNSTTKTRTHKRTYIFSAEVGSVTYNEIGWSPSSGAGANLFGRDIISGGISLVAGQQLKAVVELILSFAPITPVAYTNVVTGWTQDGQAQIESVSGTSSVNTNGSTTENNTGALEAVNNSKFICISEDATALRAVNNGAQPLSLFNGFKVASSAAYTPGNRYRDFFYTWTVSDGISTAIRSLVLGYPDAGYGMFRVLLDAVEEKDNSHTLTLTFRLSWRRVLTN